VKIDINKHRDSLPKSFKISVDAAEFWETHDLTDFDGVLEAVHFEVDIQERIFIHIMENEENQDFGAMLAAFEAEQGTVGKDPEVGEKVTGTVLSVGPDMVFVDLGAKSEGMIPAAELRDDDGDITVIAGDTVEALVSGQDADSGCLILRVKAGKGEAAPAELKNAYEHRIPVEGRVSGVNKGGLEVEVAGIRAFCPVSQIADTFVEDPNEFLGQRLTFRITRYEEDPRGRRPNIVLSRRALLAEESERRREEAREHLAPGKRMIGKVTSLASYGAFIDLGGIEGLLHVSEISHRRLEHPNEVLTVGQELEVEILKIEEAPARKDGGKGDRISLSRKTLEQDPWHEAVTRFPAGTVTRGEIVRLQPFGAFVRLAPGVDGLVHISELGADRRVTHPKEVVEVGQSVEVRVLKVEPETKRIALSMAAAARVEEEAMLEEYLDSDDVGPEIERAKREKSGQTGPGFGAMADFFKKADLDSES
jgi:small subunit ribosomal protein S1